MQKHKPLPAREWLIEHLHYEPNTGLFRWIKGGPKKVTSAYAGCKCYQAYSGEPANIQIRIQGKNYAAHRIAWLMATGEDPGEMTVDHINRNAFDNRLCNLRLADHSLQMRNRRNMGASQYKGVFYRKNRNRWVATCTVDGKRRYLGYFKTEEEAAKAAAPHFIL